MEVNADATEVSTASAMEVEALRVQWLQIPLAFPGLPEELKVKVKAPRGGCWSRLVRRYKTRLSLPLDGLQWRPHNGHLRYHLTPPLLFSWDRELVSRSRFGTPAREQSIATASGL